MSSGDLSDALAALAILVDGGAVQYQWGSTDSLTVETGNAACQHVLFR